MTALAAPVSRPPQAPAVVGLGLDCLGVHKQWGETPVLIDVSFSARPGELIGILGPSGAGKSTLLSMVNGYATPDAGEVLLGGTSMSEPFAPLTSRIGFVPQDDIVHTSLTVRESLEYAVRLRLPDCSPDRRVTRIQRALEEVGLEARADLQVRRLSGGQRKRVSVAVELITDPAVLILDEPTSGLDPASERQMMTLFRRLADAGRTVLLTTHVMERVDLMDQLVVLVDGRLAYSGPPISAQTYFGIRRLAELFGVLGQRSARAWAELYRRSADHRRHLERVMTRPTSPSTPVALPARGQLLSLLRRTAHLMTVDTRNLGLLLLQAPLIGLFIGLAYDASSPRGQAEVLFNMVLAAIWFGAINACREIVKERAIYLRERRCNLRILPYVGAKTLVGSALCAVQAVLLLGVVVAFCPLTGSGAWACVTLFAASQAGLSLGLAVSATVDTPDKAVSLVPILLIPQAIFVGVGRDVTGVAALLESFTISRWGFGALGQIARGAPTVDVLADLTVLVLFTAFCSVITCLCLLLKDRPS